MDIWHNSWLEDVRHAKMDLSGPRETRQCPVKLASSSGSPRGNKGWRFTVGFKSLDWSIRLGSRFVWAKNGLLCFICLQRGVPENPYAKDGSKNWLQRATLYRHKKILLCQGRLQAKSRWNYMILWWFFINFSGLINSFELSSCVVSDIISSLLVNPAGSSGKSIRERLGDVKVGPLDGNLTEFMIRGR